MPLNSFPFLHRSVYEYVWTASSRWTASLLSDLRAPGVRELLCIPRICCVCYVADYGRQPEAPSCHVISICPRHPYQQFKQANSSISTCLRKRSLLISMLHWFLCQIIGWSFQKMLRTKSKSTSWAPSYVISLCLSSIVNFST